jgi:hypothetical protein
LWLGFCWGAGRPEAKVIDMFYQIFIIYFPALINGS